jgi:hypothetical protein
MSPDTRLRGYDTLGGSFALVRRKGKITAEKFHPGGAGIAKICVSIHSLSAPRLGGEPSDTVFRNVSFS